MAASGERGIKEVLLEDEHFHYLDIIPNRGTRDLIGKTVSEIKLPPGNLIPVIRRSGRNIIPTGDTIIESGDRITVLGDPKFLKELRLKYTD